MNPPFPKYHLLIEQSSSFFHAGDAHLGSFASDGSSATFSLGKPLPRVFWVQIGGYPHWMVEVNHESHRVAPDEGNSLHKLLCRVIDPPYGHMMLTRYEADSLHLFTNALRGWLMYLREPGDIGLYVAEVTEEDNANERFTCDCGIALEFPRSRTLPVAQAASLVQEFFHSGTLPSSVSWQPE